MLKRRCAKVQTITIGLGILEGSTMMVICRRKIAGKAEVFSLGIAFTSDRFIRLGLRKVMEARAKQRK